MRADRLTPDHGQAPEAGDAPAQGPGTVLGASASARAGKGPTGAQEPPSGVLDAFADGPGAGRRPDLRDWFRGSQVVDERGEPKVLFHGARSQGFEEFSTERGAYFSADPSMTQEYGPHLVAAVLRVVNPLVATHEENAVNRDRLVAKARRLGHDGVFLPKDQDFADTMIYDEALYDVWVALDPAQIRCVDADPVVVPLEDLPRPGMSEAPARQVDSPEFRAWFRDSKVLWEGQPLVVYHGTSAEFEAFDKGCIGTNFGDPAGIFFTNNTSHDVHWVQNHGDIGGMDARLDEKGDMVRPKDPRYQQVRVWDDDTSAGAYAKNAKGGEFPSIMPVYVNLQNPLVIDRDLDGGGILSAIETRRRPAGEFIRDEVVAAGYDGLIVFDRDVQFKNGQPEILVVALDPSQIKSAIGNSGTFDPANPDIRA